MWIEIFRTGTHTDSAGRSAAFDAAALDDIARVYNERISKSASYEAPLVKGHPQSDAPAFGWVGRLARRGDRLVAKLKNVVPQISDEVRKGLFRKISVSLYQDKMLRHVGLLGGAAPAVKGLRNISFSEGDHADFEFNAEKNDEPEEGSSFAEMREENGRLAAENEKLANELTEFKEKIAFMEKGERLAEFREFCNSLIDHPEGALITPAQSNELVDIMEMAYQSDLRGEDAAAPALEKVKNFMASLKPVFSFREFTAPGNSEPQEDEFDGRNVSAERLEIHKRAGELQRNIAGLSYEEAVCMAFAEEK